MPVQSFLDCYFVRYWIISSKDMPHIYGFQLLHVCMLHAVLVMLF